MRRCCSAQASIDWRLRLHNSTQARRHAAHAYDASRCEYYDLAAVERGLAQSAFCAAVAEPERRARCKLCGEHLCAGAIGHCKATNDAIRGGKDFNGRYVPGETIQL